MKNETIDNLTRRDASIKNDVVNWVVDAHWNNLSSLHLI